MAAPSTWAARCGSVLPGKVVGLVALALEHAALAVRRHACIKGCCLWPSIALSSHNKPKHSLLSGCRVGADTALSQIVRLVENAQLRLALPGSPEECSSDRRHFSIFLVASRQHPSSSAAVL